MARWHSASVVTNDGHTVPNVIVVPGVCPEVVPTSAFIDVAIRADHKAETADICQNIKQNILYLKEWEIEIRFKNLKPGLGYF